MPDPIAVRVPQVNVNDEQVRILAWQVESGQQVQQGQLIVEVETSKSAVEIEAAGDGYIHYTRQVDEEVAVGDILYFLADSPSLTMPVAALAGPAAGPSEAPRVAAVGIDRIEEPPSQAVTPAVRPAVAPAAEPEPITTTRFSARARTRIEQQGLDPASFAGRGLVREHDVAGTIDGRPTRPARPAAPVREVSPGPIDPGSRGVPVRSEPLSRQKAMEGKLLAASYFTALASSVTIACPTRGFRRAVATEPALRANATALMIFETARLLRQYPVFNAYCRDTDVCYYEQVNIGFAVDAGFGLKVLVVHEADTKTAETIANEMHELVAAYLEDRLPAKSLGGGTFTLTDLSGEDVTTFHPLLNQGQSAILGVSGERMFPGQQEGAFHLVLTFDHRVTEGRTAARFLNALRARLAAHEAALTPVSRSTDVTRGEAGTDLYCLRCMRTVDQLKLVNGYLVQSAYPAGLLCSICLSGF